MRDELDRLKVFFQDCQEKRDIDHVVRALEDLPEDAREQALMVMDVPDADSFAKKVLDVTTDVATDLYGTLERVKYLHFLSLYPVLSYVYELSSSLSRGSRPSPTRLAALARDGYRATINLCAEAENGDAPQIESAGLGSSLSTYHLPITDGTPPRLDQVMELLALLADPQTGRVYMHCEAGKARTGVMSACYRLAVMGWSLEGALLEARNFGLSIPDQVDFIQDFGDQLAKGSLELAGYPREPLGSHRLTAAERDATIAKIAAAEKS
jgi:protein tyrosine phosphatase (PTP) superfamily phosphohydrolase (DUF442 family)